MDIGQLGIDVAGQRRGGHAREACGQHCHLPLPIPSVEGDNFPTPAVPVDEVEPWIEPTRIPLIRDEAEFLRKFSRLLRPPHLFSGSVPPEPLQRLEQAVTKRSPQR